MAFFDAQNFKKATFARRFLNSRELPPPHSIGRSKSSSNGSKSAADKDGRGDPGEDATLTYYEIIQ